MSIPEIIRAREAGACYGVERALELTKQAAQDLSEVATLGPLIHNPRVIADLSIQGVEAVEEVHAAAGKALVLRTHGTSPLIEQEAREACPVVIDATCPFVKKVHRATKDLDESGYFVVVIGEAGHPEVEATLSYAQHAQAIGTLEEARILPYHKKIGIVVQTTARQALFEEIVDELAHHTDDLVVHNTICEATHGHQSACAEIARTVDVMLIVGGKISANTTHLAQIARLYCEATHHIEHADELISEWFEGARRIGISAGASTPAEHIDAVESRLRTLLTTP